MSSENRPLPCRASTAPKVPQQSASCVPLHLTHKLMVPAVQLVNRDNVFRQFKNGQQEVLVVSAHRWLATLPY